MGTSFNDSNDIPHFMPVVPPTGEYLATNCIVVAVVARHVRINTNSITWYKL